MGFLLLIELILPENIFFVNSAPGIHLKMPKRLFANGKDQVVILRRLNIVENLRYTGFIGTSKFSNFTKNSASKPVYYQWEKHDRLIRTQRYAVCVAGPGDITTVHISKSTSCQDHDRILD